MGSILTPSCVNFAKWLWYHWRGWWCCWSWSSGWVVAEVWHTADRTLSFHTGHRPFQCHYCPYSASQKGNLKTHVLCVHRMPFDNSQYPDRRFKRSRVDSEASGNFEEAATVKAGGFADLTDERGKGQEEGNWAEPVLRNIPLYSFKSCSWSHQFANCIPREGGNHVQPLSSV